MGDSHQTDGEDENVRNDHDRTQDLAPIPQLNPPALDQYERFAGKQSMNAD